MTTKPPVRRIRALGAGTVAGLVGAVVLVAGPSARPAHACSCLARTEADAFASSDAVFRGQVAGYQAPPPDEHGIQSFMDPAVWTFAVTEVFKGDVAPTQPILSPMSGAACGLEIPHQGEFFVFAGRRQPGDTAYPASLCGGTRSTAEGPLAIPGAVTTTIAPPTTEAPPVTTIPPATVVVTTEPPPATTLPTTPPTTTAAREEAALAAPTAISVSADSGDDRLPGGLVVGAGAGALLGLFGVGALRRRRRAVTVPREGPPEAG